MTVRELIEKLEQFNDNTEVLVHKNGYVFEINNIKKLKYRSCFGADDDAPAAIIILGEQAGGIY